MACTAILAVGAARAEVTRFEVLSIERGALEGRTFGDVGTYDRVRARATVAVDPGVRRNQSIVDIDGAPRNAAGKVEAVADVEILRPSDPKRGSGKLLYEAVNRGTKLAAGIFNDASSTALTRAADAGNGYLMREGYTLVWSGWQGDLKSAPGTLAIDVPTLAGVTGRIVEEIVFDSLRSPSTVRLAWPAAETDGAKLTVRARWDDAPSSPADMSFRFVEEAGSPQSPGGLERKIVEIVRPAGFDGGAIYQLEYTARDPQVLGLGFAATRDIVAFLRHDGSASNPLAEGGRSTVRKAYAYGQSQSGRFLREFLYLGFNEDDEGRRVFDGLLPHISGARFTATNMRFGLPARAPRHPGDPGAVADRFPFTYTETTNPLTNERDGLLKRCTQSRTCPKIIQADSEFEWWSSKGSLLVTRPDGKPLKLPSNVRLYMTAGTPHIAQPEGVAQATPLCVMPVNPLHQGPVLRAMLNNLDRWVDRGVTPPPNRTPTLTDGSLVEDRAPQLKAPIPGLPYTGMHVPAEFKLYVPRLNADGMVVAGIHLPVIDAPKATYTGWNPRVEGNAPSTLCPLIGGVVPLARTREERMQTGDPRPSVEERYPSHDAYVAKVDTVAKSLVRQRLMLPEDLPRQHEAAANDTLARLRKPQ